MTIYVDCHGGGVRNDEQWFESLSFYTEIAEKLTVNPYIVTYRCLKRPTKQGRQEAKREFMKENSLREGATRLSEDDWEKIVSAGYWAGNQD